MDSYLENVMDSLSSFGTTFDNLPGLGDFHLRSAVKVVPNRLIHEEKGRFREVESVKTYRKLYADDSINNEYSCVLLMHALELCKKNEMECYYKQGITDHINVLSESSDMIRARTYLERDIFGDYNMKIHENEEVFLALKSPNCYTRGRVVWNNIVSLMNSIGSGREINKRNLSKLGIAQIRKNDNLLETFDNLYCCELKKGEFLFITGELVFLRYGVSKVKNVVHCWDINTVRMISDKCTERDIILRASCIGQIIHPEIYPSNSVINKILEIGDKCISDNKNDGYKLIKCYESICIGYLLIHSQDILVDNQEFLSSTAQDLLSEYPQFEGPLDSILAELSKCESLHHITQLYGLYRLWGHPNIDSIEGLRKVKRIGCSVKTINKYLSELAGHTFLEMLFTKYFLKNKRYPRFSIVDSAKGAIESYLVNRLTESLIIDTSHDLYDISDWKLITLEKTFSVPETFNLAMIVDDKAISPSKAFLRDVANKRAKFMDPYERRGVLKFLNQKTQDCKKFLSEINEIGLHDDHCVIGLYPKERELNNVPRMFSLMSSEMRKYVVMTEHMLADDILPFFPQITMTSDLLSLTKMIYSATKIQERSGSNLNYDDTLIMNLDKRLKNQFKYISVCINMDFEKWNLNMRKEATNGVFTQLGRCYGMENLYNATYDIFERAYIYVADENYKINSDSNSTDKLLADGTYAYRGHIGGFEGLRQKGWTIFTVVVIKMICDKHKVQYKLMGQGDNQVLVLKLYTNQLDEGGHFTEQGVDEMRQRLNNIMSDLGMTFGDLGLPLKTLESWKSESLFLYGKYPVFKGVPLSMSLKKICRCFPFSNDDNMTLDNVLGSIFTNAQAASMSELSLFIPYLIGLQEGYVGTESIMQYHPLIGQSVAKILSMSKKWELYNSGKRMIETYNIESTPSLRQLITGILTFPKSLSGSNGITLLEFTMRGFPDNHSRDMSYLKHIMDADLCQRDVEKLGPSTSKFCYYIKNISYCVSRLCFVDNLSPDFLVEDPCALNLLNPITPISVLRKKVKEVIERSGMIKNKEFQELFELASDSRKNTLCNALIQNDILFPRLLHDLYGSTLFGYIDGIVSKVDKTSTVQKISLQSSPIDIMKLVMSTETNFLKFLIWRIQHERVQDLPGEPSFDCPTNYVRWGRYYGWGKQVLGVTVPFPSHSFSGGICQVPNNSCPDNSYVSAYISQDVPMDKYARITSIGKSPPYLGSYTKEKVKTYEKVAIYGTEPLLRRVLKTLKVVGWAIGENSNVHKFLRDVLASISDLDDSLFVSDSEQVSGSMGHRYHDAALKHGALLPCMYTMGTWCHMSTDTLTDYSKGSKNVTIHFQALLCWVQIILNNILVGNKSIDMLSSYHFHISCKSCIVPVEDTVPDIIEIKNELIPSNKRNPYCYVKEIDIVRRDNSSYNNLQKLIVANKLNVNELNNKEKFYLIHEYYAERISQDIISSVSTGHSDTHVSSGLMDVGEYPRVSFLKLNPLYMFSAICFKISVEFMRRRANKSQEESWSLKGIHNDLVSLLTSSSSSGFLGLGTFYSWPEKAKEILKIPGSVSPSKYPFNIDQANAAAKESITAFAKVLFTVNSHLEGKIINFVDGSNMVNSFLGKVMLSHFNKNRRNPEPHTCQKCIQAIFKSYLSIILETDDKKIHKCSFGHYMPEFKETVRSYKFVMFSIDVVEKSYEMRKPVNLYAIFSESQRDLSILKARRFRDRSITIYNSIRDINSPPIKENLSGPELPIRNYSEIQMSKLFRLIPYEESTCYRVFELLKSDVFNGLNMKDICVIGDGSGGSSVAIAEYYQVPKIAMTLTSCDVAYPQTYPHAVPPAILRHNLDGKIDYKSSLSYKMDISNDQSRRYLNKTLMNKACKGLISEVEFEHVTNSSKEYLMLPKYVYELVGIESAALKIRLGKDGDITYVENLLEATSTFWKEFFIIITPFCNIEKREFWLIIKGKKEFQNEMVSKSFSHIHRSLYTHQSLMTMKRHFEANLFKQIEEEYYNQLNEIMMTSERVDHSSRIVESHIKRTFSRFKLGQYISWSTFLYDSVFSKVPKFVWNMGNKVGKYRYENEERELWQNFMILVCAASKSIISFKYLVDRSDHWRVYLTTNLIPDPLTIDNLRIGIVISSKKLKFPGDVRFKEISLSGDNFKSKLLRFTPLILHMYPKDKVDLNNKVGGNVTSCNIDLAGSDILLFGRKNLLEEGDMSGFTTEGRSTYMKEVLAYNRIKMNRVTILPISKTLSRRLNY